MQKKVSVTGAISSVGSAELMRTPVSSVTNVLGGQMTGLTTVQYSGEPGADAAWRKSCSAYSGKERNGYHSGQTSE